MRRNLLRPALAGLTLSACAASALGDDPLDALARGLVEKRTVVERLSNEVELEKQAEREELRSVAQQRQDVDRQLKALELELQDLRRASGEKAAEVERREAARAALAPLVLARLDALTAHVRAGLPFRTTERLAALEELRRDVASGRVAPDEGLTRLWSALDDELRLTRETALHRQTVELGGQTVLADVARVGMVLAYVRTVDGRLGLARRDGPGPSAGWRFEVLQDPTGRERLRALFDALDRHIRSGFFVLPNPHPGAAPERS